MARQLLHTVRLLHASVQIEVLEEALSTANELLAVNHHMDDTTHGLPMSEDKSETGGKGSRYSDAQVELTGGAPKRKRDISANAGRQPKRKKVVPGSGLSDGSLGVTGLPVGQVDNQVWIDMLTEVSILFSFTAHPLTIIQIGRTAGGQILYVIGAGASAAAGIPVSKVVSLLT